MMRLLIALAAAQLVACSGSHHPTSHADAGDHASMHPAGEPAHHGGGGHAHDFSDVERFAEIFDDPERNEWQHPAEVVALLGLAEGMTVVDLGAGTGYFVPHLATAVGTSGRVLALDVEPNMVAHMRERFEAAKLVNARAQIVQPDDPGIEPGSVDRILIVDTWHHITERERYSAFLRAALRPGGEIFVVDFTPESPHGPPPAMRLPAEKVAAELSSAGLEVEILEEVLPWQYVVRGR